MSRKLKSFSTLLAFAMLVVAASSAVAQVPYATQGQSEPKLAVPAPVAATDVRWTQTEKEGRILAITPSTELQVRGRLAGKLHMVITFLETKPFYSRGVSGDQFVKRALAQMEPAPTPVWLRTYLLQVYEYHVKGVSADVVYATDDGRAFSELYNAAARTYKPGMTKEEFERQLIPGTTPGYGDPQMRKPWWVNCVRKIVDFIDDHWQ
jgi:hypothetical protein